MRYFATAVPGLHPVLVREIGELQGARAAPHHEFDGRNDVVPFAAPGHDDLLALRTSEDVFAEVASVQGHERLGAVVRGLWDQRGLEQALSVYGATVRPLRTRMTFRVVSRVRSERRFLRTELRDELGRRVLQSRPRWRIADPADLELWALETIPGRFRLGIRLSSATMRHRNGRPTERPGSLRPTVAAAMARLAGPGSTARVPNRDRTPARVPSRDRMGARVPEGRVPEGRNTAGRILLDPCCGSGTILREAATLGWEPVGGDLDPTAVEVARDNLGRARLFSADVRRLPLTDASVAAVASNLPFGRQYELQGRPERWFAAALDELARVVRPGGRIVLLVPGSPAFEGALGRQSAVQAAERLELRLLGTRAALWSLHRR
jgi:23S rRNA G2445 N2-methylase RlmL